MLLMVEKGIRGGIYHAIHRYANANNKYVKNYDKKIMSSYFMDLDANNLYGSGMLQKLPVNGFKWIKKLSKFNEEFIKNYDKNSNKGHILEVDVEYPKSLFNLYTDLPLLAERKKIEQCNKLACSIYDKEKYLCCSHKSFKTSINSRINTKKKHIVIKFNQEEWLKPYIDVNTTNNT